jgi:hypothetical protein
VAGFVISAELQNRPSRFLWRAIEIVIVIARQIFGQIVDRPHNIAEPIEQAAIRFFSDSVGSLGPNQLDLHRRPFGKHNRLVEHNGSVFDVTGKRHGILLLHEFMDEINYLLV